MAAANSVGNEGHFVLQHTTGNNQFGYKYMRITVLHNTSVYSNQRTVPPVLLPVYMHEALLAIFSWNLAFED
jgi:hypothetical protein